MSVSYYHIYKDAQSEWRWRYVASNGRIIADSAEGYVRKEDAEHGITLMKAPGDSVAVVV